jgi:hypothetical protein
MHRRRLWAVSNHLRIVPRWHAAAEEAVPSEEDPPPEEDAPPVLLEVFLLLDELLDQIAPNTQQGKGGSGSPLERRQEFDGGEGAEGVGYHEPSADAERIRCTKISVGAWVGEGELFTSTAGWLWVWLYREEAMFKCALDQEDITTAAIRISETSWGARLPPSERNPRLQLTIELVHPVRTFPSVPAYIYTTARFADIFCELVARRAMP